MPRHFAILGNVVSTFRDWSLGSLLLTSLLLGNVAAADESPTLESRLSKLGYTQGESVQSINNYRVDAWNYIDDKHVMIYTGVSSRALLTLLSTCPELSSVEHIGFSSTAGHLTTFDKIVTRGAGGFHRDCQISEIHQLDSTKTKEH